MLTNKEDSRLGLVDIVGSNVSCPVGWLVMVGKGDVDSDAEEKFP